MNRKVRAIIVDGTEIMTSYTAVEIADRLRIYDDLKEENERLNNKIKEQNLLLIEFQDMEQKLKLKDNIIKIMEKYFELIIDLGYDYDGLNEEGSLKNLIDELCKYASLGRTYNITEPIYENENKKYNILHEELKESN